MENLRQEYPNLDKEGSVIGEADPGLGDNASEQEAPPKNPEPKPPVSDPTPEPDKGKAPEQTTPTQEQSPKFMSIIPPKFRRDNPEDSVSAMLQSYNELERKLTTKNQTTPIPPVNNNSLAGKLVEKIKSDEYLNTLVSGSLDTDGETELLTLLQGEANNNPVPGNPTQDNGQETPVPAQGNGVEYDEEKVALYKKIIALEKKELKISLKEAGIKVADSDMTNMLNMVYDGRANDLFDASKLYYYDKQFSLLSKEKQEELYKEIEKKVSSGEGVLFPDLGKKGVTEVALNYTTATENIRKEYGYK